jgi:hypothetical protein
MRSLLNVFAIRSLLPPSKTKRSIATDDIAHRQIPHQQKHAEHQPRMPFLDWDLLLRRNGSSSLESSQASISSSGNRWQRPYALRGGRASTRLDMLAMLRSSTASCRKKIDVLALNILYFLFFTVTAEKHEEKIKKPRRCSPCRRAGLASRAAT